jgi:hypothetical protein
MRTTTDTARDDARAILAACQITIGEDFYTLSASQVGALLDYADRHKYRKPRNANGSRGRYFHALIQRRAQ